MPMGRQFSCLINSPQLCVGFLFPTTLCGVLVFGSAPPGRVRLLDSSSSSSTAAAAAASSSHIIFHTQLCHIQLCHTPFFTHIIVTHHLSHIIFSHTTLSHTIFSHTSLSHTIFHTHTHIFVTLSHIVRQAWHLWDWAGSGGAAWVRNARDAAALLRGRCGTWRHRPAFCVAGVALGDIDLRFAWQAWYLAISTFVLRGERGTDGTGLGLARLGPLGRP